jgi:hypothetical protein
MNRTVLSLLGSAAPIFLTPAFVVAACAKTPSAPGVYKTVIIGKVYAGCRADPDDPLRKVEPCFSHPLPKIWVTLTYNKSALTRTKSDRTGHFRFTIQRPGVYDVIGGGACSERLLRQVIVTAGHTPAPISIIYPNDRDDSPYATCGVA